MVLKERVTDRCTEHLAPPPKMAIFIDGPYLSKAAETLKLRDHNEDFDFKKMLAVLRGNCRLLFANYYTGLSFSPSAQGFFTKIESFGYQVVESRDNPITDKVAPVDHQLLTDVCLCADTYKIATIVSGDGDFAYAIERLARDHGKIINVVAARHSTSRNIIALTNKYPGQVRIFYLDDICENFLMRRVFPGPSKFAKAKIS